MLRVTEDERFLPGRSLDHIGLEEITAAVRGTEELNATYTSSNLRPAVEVMRDLDSAIHAKLDGRNLRDLVDDAEATEYKQAEVPA